MILDLKRISASRFLIIAASVILLLYTFVKPPFQSPDEFNHFCRAYQISQGHFTAEVKDNRLGGTIPTALWNYFAVFKEASCDITKKTSYHDIQQTFGIQINSKETVFVDFPNTAIYSPVSYLPAAMAIYLLSGLSDSVTVIYYGSIYFTFFVWLFSMFYVVKSLPIFQWLFVALLLNPMQMYLLQSCSGDHVTNLLSFVLLALVLNCYFDSAKVTNRVLLAITAIAVLLAFTKIVYATLILLLFVIGSEKFGSKRKKLLVCAVSSLLVFGLARYWSNVSLQKSISYNQYNPSNRDWVTLKKGADYVAQKIWLMEHPGQVFKVVVNSLVDDPLFYLRSYIGHFGTYMDLPVDTWFYVVSYLLLLLLAFADAGNFILTWLSKFQVALIAFLTLSMLILSQYLTWTLVGSDKVDMIQGRYLIPIAPMFFLLVYRKKTVFNFYPIYVCVCYVLLSYAYVLPLLHERYF